MPPPPPPHSPDCVLSSYAEALEGIEMGEATHKKPGTTVPESIHSFSEWLPFHALFALFALVLIVERGHFCPLFCQHTLIPSQESEIWNFSSTTLCLFQLGMAWCNPKPSTRKPFKLSTECEINWQVNCAAFNQSASGSTLMGSMTNQCQYEMRHAKTKMITLLTSWHFAW